MSGFATIAAIMAVFVPALLLPGPDFVGVLRATIAGGRGAGLRAAAGVAVGLTLYATAGLLGLSAILVRFEWLAWAVRIAGGCYLVWLGIGLLRSREAGPADDPGPTPVRGGGFLFGLSAEAGRVYNKTPVRGGGFLFGLSVTLTNPKAIVLFASLFATSVGPATPGWVHATLVLLVGLLSLAWYALVASLLGSDPAQERLARARRAIDRVAGGCFLLFGGKVLTDARNPLSP
jgi:threonine/homoserine/homoserine lactone efflux protein